MGLSWLATELRKAGLTVVEHTNWQTHDRTGSWSPTFGVVHATAAPRTQRDSVQVAVVRDGRSDLPGPIANAVVDRLGRWHVVGAGRCNSTLTGTAGPYEGRGNTNALSTEACNDNRSEPWPDVQYRSYVRGWAAWCRRLGWSADRLVGHKEHTPGRKTDPTFSMATFRRDVAAVLAGEDDDMPLTPAEKLDIAKLTAKEVWALRDTVSDGKARAMGDVVNNVFESLLLRRADSNVVQDLVAIKANLASLAGRDWVDEQEIVDGVLAGLGSRNLADVATALRAAFGDRLPELISVLAQPPQG